MISIFYTNSKLSSSIRFDNIEKIYFLTLSLSRARIGEKCPRGVIDWNNTYDRSERQLIEEKDKKKIGREKEPYLGITLTLFQE